MLCTNLKCKIRTNLAAKRSLEPANLRFKEKKKERNLSRFLVFKASSLSFLGGPTAETVCLFRRLLYLSGKANVV